MFGLLGGLLGGGLAGGIGRGLASKRPVLGRALGGLLDKRPAPQSQGRSVQQEPAPNDDSTDTPEQPQVVTQAAPERPPVVSAQPATQPLAQSSPNTFASAQPEPPKTALSGLLEDAPPADVKPQTSEAGELQPQSIVNKSQANTTVARPENEVFGEAPTNAPTDMGNQVTLDKPDKLPRLQPEWKDYLPLTSPDLPAPSLGIDLPYRSSPQSGLGTTGFGFRYMRA